MLERIAHSGIVEAKCCEDGMEQFVLFCSEQTNRRSEMPVSNVTTLDASMLQVLLSVMARSKCRTGPR